MSKKDISFNAYVATLSCYFYDTLLPIQVFDDISKHLIRSELNNRPPLMHFTDKGGVIYDNTLTHPFEDKNITLDVLVCYLGEKASQLN